MLFQDRTDAGKSLADKLTEFSQRPDVLVLALPRGGVPVAFEVAQELHLPLDVFPVCKLGVPDQPELAMGAIASGGVRVLNDHVVNALNIPRETIEEAASAELKELERQERLYRGDWRRLDVAGKTVILVDDGLATGSTMRAAIKALRQLGAARVVAAVPVGARESCRDLKAEADDVVCAQTPEPFYAVGQWYDDFSQTTDEEVRRLLEQSRTEIPSAALKEPAFARDRETEVPVFFM